jgi:hypothetical protein
VMTNHTEQRCAFWLPDIHRVADLPKHEPFWKKLRRNSWPFIEIADGFIPNSNHELGNRTNPVDCH